MTYTGITYKDPEYRILEPIVDDDMCSVMMRMRLEKEPGMTFITSFVSLSHVSPTTTGYISSTYLGMTSDSSPISRTISAPSLPAAISNADNARSYELIAPQLRQL